MNDRTHKLFAAMFTDKVGEGDNARLELIKEFRRQGKHPADAKIVVNPGDLYNRQQALIERMAEERAEQAAVIRRLEAELAAARAHGAMGGAKGAARAVRRARKAAKLVSRWPEFEALVRERLGGLPRGWQAKVIAACGVKRHVLKQWREERVQVPDGAFEKAGTAL